jgi:glycosyltransferase involved in cell wall biosynthesis
MLQALDRLDRNDVELVLVGTASADIRLDLESWAKDPRFRVVPWEPPLRVYERLAQADIGLACLHPLPRYIDARPVKLFEYMAAGIPVIASDFAGYRRIIEEANCGLVVDPLDPDQLAEAIRFLLDSPEERMRLGRNGRKAVEERYNWRSEEEKLLELYARITARTPAR